MELITREFLDDYLKPHRVFSKKLSSQWSFEIAKEFEQTLPITHKAFTSGPSLLKKMSPDMMVLTLELGMLMFDVYRRFYGGFAKPEREGMADEKCGDALQIMMTWEPESGVSRAKQTELLHGFFKQSMLMGFFTLKIRNFTDENPKEKPYLTAGLMHLAVLAAQLNELVGAPKKEPEADQFIAPDFQKKDRRRETIPDDFLQAYLKLQTNFTAADRLLWQARREAEFRRTLPRTQRTFVASLTVLQRRNKDLAFATQQLGNFMFDIYHKFYGSFLLPERKGLWEENNHKASNIMRTLHPANKTRDEKAAQNLQAFVRQNILLGRLMYSAEKMAEANPERELCLYEICLRLATLAAQLNTLVGLAKAK